jgi:hypothetical protein
VVRTCSCVQQEEGPKQGKKGIIFKKRFELDGLRVSNEGNITKVK